MGRTTRTEQQNNPTSAEPVAVPLPEAARRLGLPSDTIRRRLDRGRIAGFRAASGRVMVMMRGDDLVQAEPEQSEQNTRTTRTASEPPPPAPEGAVIAVLRDQIADLRARLDRAEVAQGELRQLLLAAHRTIADMGERLALPGPNGDQRAEGPPVVIVEPVERRQEPPPRSLAEVLARARARGQAH